MEIKRKEIANGINEKKYAALGRKKEIKRVAKKNR